MADKAAVSVLVGEQVAALGALRIPGLITALIVNELRQDLAPLPLERPGLRMQDVGRLGTLLGPEGPVGRLATQAIGASARPVRALLFDKSAGSNWKLGWHQDRVIAVTARRDVAGFGPWSIKRGVIPVAPPIEILASMVTIRLHLDDVDKDNAPLLVAPGSHRLGIVREPDIATTVAACGTLCCEAAAGDAWLYSTLILHASDAAARPRRRRVLQVDYAASPLPAGLEWLGL